MSTEIHTIYPQLEAQSKTFPRGRCLETHYVVSKGTVILTNDEGEPLRDSWGEPYGNKIPDGLHHATIAGRLALKRHRENDNDPDGFKRAIDYGPRGGW
jgi:hypothetical protein